MRARAHAQWPPTLRTCLHTRHVQAYKYSLLWCRLRSQKKFLVGRAMSRLSSIPLLGSGSDLQVEGLSASGSETVSNSPLEHQGLKMASPAATPEGIKLSEVQAAEGGEKPSLKSQQSTVSQAANVKGQS